MQIRRQRMHGTVVKVGWIILGIILEGFVVEGLWCDRAPHSVGVPKTSGDNGFRVVISGDPEKPDKYIPGAVYTVRLQGPGSQFSVEKFTGFLLVAEPTDGLSPESSAGNFQLTKSDSFARFSEYCPHAVKHASEVPKSEVQVQWIAPAVATGCVSFRATIIKNKGQWFMDDGELTKQLCPETEVGEEENEDTEPCCACDEAKYELTFEGLWSPLTHPKEFPADAWSAHFSDIVGASHSPTFKFWQQNEPASEGLRQLAEAGDSKDLERELKDESAHIRTIIKARGLRHPNFYGHKTFAVFRADRDHNLVSLVSKIAPSPDWFVGVAALNLCLRNCSWTDSKIIPLYPWDAGTDSGISYLAEKNPTIPRERISRIVWNPRPESPFYDPSGNMVKPFAKLRIQKQRSYERTCDEDARRAGPNYSQDWDEDEDSFEDRPECAVTQWIETPCSATCGKGVLHRKRQFLDLKAKELGCSRKLTQSVACDSHVPCAVHSSGSNYNGNTYRTSGGHYGGGGGSNNGNFGGGSTPGGSQVGRDDPCATTKWRPWGTCSKTCGQGIHRRRREFVNPGLAETYNCNKNVLVENEQCFGSSRNCNEPEQIIPGCETTDWGDWEACSATVCGNGMRQRHRMYAVPARSYTIGCNASLMESEACSGLLPDCDPSRVQEICMLPRDPGSCDGSYSRWYFDSQSKTCSKFKYSGCQGNANMFDKEDECEKTCGSLKEDAFSEPMMRHQSYHGNAGYRSVNNLQSSGNSINPNVYNPFSSNQYPLHEHIMSATISSQSPFNDGPVSDCDVSEWGAWSGCSVSCGRGHKYRTRYIKRFPENGGAPCPKLEHRRKCKGMSCPQNHQPYSYQQYGGASSSTDGHGYYDGYIH
ncbi:spondin-1 isoform X2 [Folsomia candida]|uniref:spondin-1 isoform X2 n=1 Tax=Folsomia candida TaxID=158441 RepID=UPI000B8FDB51|nr:spondin-1 isoform X2 [Folsomia candida]